MLTVIAAETRIVLPSLGNLIFGEASRPRWTFFLFERIGVNFTVFIQSWSGFGLGF